MTIRITSAFAAVCVLVFSASIAEAQQRPLAAVPLSTPPADIATPPGLPQVGKWMIARDGSVAHWLGERVDGKMLHEPINVILIDGASTTADQARRTLTAAATKAGYPVRFGHSTGYRGFIGGSVYGQLPQGRDDAFSNRIFEETNNHGRIFGPHAYEGGFVFVGAFSREAVDFLRDPPHRYASFKQARDNFAAELTAHTAFRPAGMAPLDNAISGNPDITTGDHDGLAVVLKLDAAQKP